MEYKPKEKFVERMKLLLKDENDLKRFFESAKTPPKKSIRVNTLKISEEELIKKLEKKGWKFSFPCKGHREIIRIESELEPGELGRAKEHLFGYYYIQEITSMMPLIALFSSGFSEKEKLLDLCAAPGSKTTQAAAIMKNKGSIIANDISGKRIRILCANLERCGVMNTVVIKREGGEACSKFKKLGFKFDKILLDAPCSGEGNLRVTPKTYLEWSEKLLESLSKKQKRLVKAAFEILKDGGEMIYSTCTYAPEENEEVIQYLLDNFKEAEIVKVNLPLKTREGIEEWKGKKFSKELRKAVRIYHHDNDAEGFFLCKIRKTTKKFKNENFK